MPKKRQKSIVIASVLKPSLDIRAYEKIGLSLFRKFKIPIHFFGQPTNKNIPFNNSIHVHSPYSFNRTSLKRFFVPFLFLKLLIKVRPTLIIICTHELIVFSIIYKLLFKTTIIYDIQEDYFRNCYYSTVYPYPLNKCLAYYVRWKEKISAKWIDHFLLAEKLYENDLTFINTNYTIIENKAIKPALVNYKEIPKSGITFLLTGTLTTKFGLIEALNFIDKYQEIDSTSNLKIIGYAPIEKDRIELLNQAQNKNYIEVIGINEIIDHELIIEVIKTSDIALLPYKLDKDTIGRVPTKLYEYLAHKTPMIIQNNESWKKITTPYNASIYIDYNDFDLDDLSQKTYQNKFYNKLELKGIYWEEEERKLIQTITPYLS